MAAEGASVKRDGEVVLDRRHQVIDPLYAPRARWVLVNPSGVFANRNKIGFEPVHLDLMSKQSRTILLRFLQVHGNA